MSEEKATTERVEPDTMLTGGLTCLIMNGSTVIFSSRDSGIRPLLEAIRQKVDTVGCIANDKIVGKAAALLYVYMGVAQVRAEVMSQAGLAVLNAHAIHADYRTLTDRIINRRGDGICPMEQTVADIDDPAQALVALEETVRRLMAANHAVG